MPVHKHTVGTAEIWAITDIRKASTNNQHIESVDPIKWEKYQTIYSQRNLINMVQQWEYICYLIISENKKILVDSGIGSQYSSIKPVSAEN